MINHALHLAPEGIYLLFTLSRKLLEVASQGGELGFKVPRGFLDESLDLLVEGTQEGDELLLGHPAVVDLANELLELLLDRGREPLQLIAEGRKLVAARNQK